MDPVGLEPPAKRLVRYHVRAVLNLCGKLPSGAGPDAISEVPEQQTRFCSRSIWFLNVPTSKTKPRKSALEKTQTLDSFLNATFCLVLIVTASRREANLALAHPQFAQWASTSWA